MAAVAVAAAGAADTDTLLIGSAIIPDQMNTGCGIESAVVSGWRGTRVCSCHAGDVRLWNIPGRGGDASDDGAKDHRCSQECWIVAGGAGTEARYARMSLSSASVTTFAV